MRVAGDSTTLLGCTRPRRSDCWAAWPRWSEICWLTTRSEVDRELASGAISRLRRGTYALGDVVEVRAQAEAVAGTVSHLSAAMAHGWKVKFTPERPTVTLPRNRSLPTGCDLEVHWQDLHLQQLYRGVTRPVER